MYFIKTIKFSFLILVTIIFMILPLCKTAEIQQSYQPEYKQLPDKYKDFLAPVPEAEELFRVLIISDRYEYSQMRFEDQITRIEDKEGDDKTLSQMKLYDKIDEENEAVMTVWLYPDSGNIMKIRTKTIAPIMELNSLILEDIKRWHFKFTGTVAEPNVFDVKYKAVLRKMQSDEEIMKEVQERDKKDEKKEVID